LYIQNEYPTGIHIRDSNDEVNIAHKNSVCITLFTLMFFLSQFPITTLIFVSWTDHLSINFTLQQTNMYICDNLPYFNENCIL